LNAAGDETEVDWRNPSCPSAIVHVNTNVSIPLLVSVNLIAPPSAPGERAGASSSAGVDSASSTRPAAIESWKKGPAGSQRRFLLEALFERQLSASRAGDVGVET
jgi:hypothetical protein